MYVSVCIMLVYVCHDVCVLVRGELAEVSFRVTVWVPGVELGSSGWAAGIYSAAPSQQPTHVDSIC